MSFEISMQELEQRLGYTFQKPELLAQALTHKSFRFEKSSELGDASKDNEKLEFLGDAVLDLALSDLLMRSFALDQEGALSKKRASLVNEDSLASFAKALQLDEILRLGKGEKMSQGLQKPRMLACCFEAVLGAVYVDGGFTQAFTVIEKLFTPKFSEIALQPDFAQDFKTRLQEWTQEKYKKVPKYTLMSEIGPDHNKAFIIHVTIESDFVAEGQGRSKKAAEQDAARNALEILERKTLGEATNE